MANQGPIALQQALSAEYQSLRADGDFVAATEADLFAKVHRLNRPLSALCISGGGVRSATFALGAIQGLAEAGLLRQFDYLSTVSGGGYIGSWLTSWMNRAGGIDAVIPHLRRDAPRVVAPNPDPIKHLREYNNYLTPKLGAFSTDTWTLPATVFRNILLNWMVLIPLLMFALLLPRVFVSALTFPYQDPAIIAADGQKDIDYEDKSFNRISESAVVDYGLPVFGGLCFTFALFHILWYLPGVGNEDHNGYDFVRNILLPLILSIFCYICFNQLYYLGSNYSDYSGWWTVILTVEIPCLTAWLLFILCSKRPWKERIGVMFGPLFPAIATMAAGTGAASWVLSNKILWNPDPAHQISWAAYVTVALPLLLVGFTLGAALYIGLSSNVLQDDDREWMSRACGYILMFGAAWLGVCFIVLVLPQYALTWNTWGKSGMAAMGALSGWASAFLRPAGKQGNGGSRLMPLVAKIAPFVFVALLCVGLSLVANMLLTTVAPLLHPGRPAVAWWDHYRVLERTSLVAICLMAAACLLLSWFMARYVNINCFSLHDMYRDRLVRAYLGASNPKREANKFTGFAATDDIPMANLSPTAGPLHVLNLTLNVVSGDRLAWQQRKAESFTVTRLYSGAHRVGYRPSAQYGGRNGITLGTALTISGAAASPNMGYHSSPLIGFIMTLLNARLGAWLGSPGPAGETTWTDAGPRSAFTLLAKEALGLTSDSSKYIYLSDGGHFENLGLYEMVLRRVKTIIVLDAGCDPSLSLGDLGNAMRKIRIDLKIPIVFDKDSTDLSHKKRRCALGVIQYSAADGACEDGRLIVVKPVLLGSEQPDVLSYAADFPAFPHQSTADQWFNESQTESYRMLGLDSVDDLSAGWQGGSVHDFPAHVGNSYVPGNSRATAAGSGAMEPPAR